MTDSSQQRPKVFTINPLHSLARGLVFAGLGGESGTYRLKDSTRESQNNNGILTGYSGVGNLPKDRWSKAIGRQTLSFNGSTNFVAIKQIIFAYPLTLAIWCKPSLSSNSGVAIYIGPDNGDNDGCWISFGAGGSAFAITNGVPSGSVPYTANIWYSAIAIFSSSTSRTLYLNGISGTIGTDDRTPANWLHSYVGRNCNFGSPIYWNGDITDAMIWNRTLNPMEIQALSIQSNVLMNYGGTPLINEPRMSTRKVIWWPAPLTGPGAMNYWISPRSIP